MPEIKLPNILITGTPGCGKSLLCSKLIKKLSNFKWQDVSKIAKDNNYVEEICDEFECPLLNEDEVKSTYFSINNHLTSIYSRF